MSDSGEKSFKTNGLNTDPLQRLPSFKAPRDFSLGAVKPNKKIFTPNLNVSRSKNKVQLPLDRGHKADDKTRKDRKNDRNKHLKNGPHVIKSSGVFSEGLGAVERHSSRISYGRDTDVSSTIQKPTLRIKDNIRIDKDLEDQKIKSVLGDTSNLEDDNVEDFKLLKDRDAPIKLPMDDGGRLYSKLKPTVKVKQEVIVKKEPGEDGDFQEPLVEKTPSVSMKEEFFENTDVVNILRNDQPTLILLQLPDSLPGRGGTSEDDHPRPKGNVNKPSTSNGEETKEEKPVDNRCQLSQLEEGCIGKMRVHRSGKVTLLLGDTEFEVCAGTKASFHQEAVSVAVDEASESANLVALGPLQHKLNLVPVWENLFSDLSV